jgi:hypothetical protein
MEHSVPCYRCGARQDDPVRGASPWRRGVRADEQVLICPDCQQHSSWQDELDRCPVCGSTALIRRLGTTVCRDCEARRLGTGQGAPVPVPVGSAAAGGTAPPAEAGTRRQPVPTAGAPEAAETTGDQVVGEQSERDLAREVAAAIDRVLGRP